jgi:hypothetical protein
MILYLKDPLDTTKKTRLVLKKIVEGGKSSHVHESAELKF